jgi:hypothetical protein
MPHFVAISYSHSFLAAIRTTTVMQSTFITKRTEEEEKETSAFVPEDKTARWPERKSSPHSKQVNPPLLIQTRF